MCPRFGMDWSSKFQLFFRDCGQYDFVKSTEASKVVDIEWYVLHRYIHRSVAKKTNMQKKENVKNTVKNIVKYEKMYLNI